jgi:hypothetical protein
VTRVPYSTARLELPTEVQVGSVPFKVVATLTSKPDWPSFAAALQYVDGPAPSVRVRSGDYVGELPKGMALVVYVEPCPDPPYTLEFPGYLELTTVGTYAFAGLSGYYSNGWFYYESRDDRQVVVRSPTVPVPGGELPWWWLAVPVAVAGVVIVGAIALEQERRREEQLLTLLLARRGR